MALGDAEILGAFVPHHPAAIGAMAVSPDGKLVYAASDALPAELGGEPDPGVRIWELSTGAELGRLGDQVSFALDVSAAGDRLVSADRDGTVRVWQLDGAELAREIAVGDDLVWAGFGAGDQIVTAERGGRIVAHPAGKGEAAIVRTVAGLSAVAVSADGSWLALGDEAGKVEVVALGGDGAGGVIIETGSEVSALDFSPSGARLAVGTSGAAYLFDRAKGAELSSTTLASGWPTRAVAVLPDETRVAVGLSIQGQELALWNSADGSVARARGIDGGAVALAALPDGERFVSGDNRGDLRVWSTEVVQPEPYYSYLLEARAVRGHTGRIGGLGFAGDGAVYAYDGAVGLRRWTGGEPATPEMRGRLLAVSPSGKLLAVVDVRNEMEAIVEVWEVGAEPARKLHATTLTMAPERAAFAGDDSALVIVRARYEGGLSRIDVADGSMRALAGVEQGEVVQALAVDAAGERVAVGPGAGQVSIVGMDGALQKTLKAPDGRDFLNFGALAFVGDDGLVVASQSHGLQLLSLSGGAAQTWEAGDGGQPQGTADVALHGALSTDGTRFVAGHLSGRVSLWSVPDGEKIVEASRHRSLVTRVALSPDGKDVVSGDAQGVLLRWPSGR